MSASDAVDTTPRPAPVRSAARPPSAWSLTWHGISTVARLEVRQRIRSTRWIVSLAVFGLIVGGVTTLTWAVARTAGGSGEQTGPTMFGFIVFFVLFLGLLVSPTLSATAINGDRAAGTLATLQVTLLSPAEIVLGKLLASWLASLAFLAVSVPFIIWAFATGGTSPLAVVTTLVLLAVVLAVVCALGLGFSALTPRTAGSAVLTYVAVGSLTFVSLIVFGLTVPLVTTEETVRVYQSDYSSSASATMAPDGTVTYEGGQTEPPCEWTEQTQSVAHTERTWWLLAVNPFVIVADAAPEPVRVKNSYGSFDPLTGIRAGVRAARTGPPEELNYCWQELGPDADMGMYGVTDAADQSPVWPWGLGANLLLAAGAVVLAVGRLTIPMRTLPRGTRVA
jgi:ABC-type transport system involved in multi-copper enzyme maturation permease subunit